mmetsp:Transcript_17916/g.29668  ORF Transcript_17916/g.29668 Transcript_17916/m.29668 type:complete len:137 (+) Transcript_17916:187-597(+)
MKVVATLIALIALIAITDAFAPASVHQRKAGIFTAMVAPQAEETPSSAEATNFNPSRWLEDVFNSKEAELALEDLKKMGAGVAETVSEVSGKVASEIKAKAEEQIVAALEETNAAIKQELNHHDDYNIEGVNNSKR